MADEWDKYAGNSSVAAPATPAASAPDEWDKYAASPASDQQQTTPGWRDQLTERINDPSNVPDTGWRGQIEKFGQGAAQGLNAVLLHPVQTAMAAGRQIMAAGATGEPGVPTTAMTGNRTVDEQNAQATADARADAAEQGRQMAANPANTLGQVAGGAIATHVLSAIPKIPEAVSTLQDSAIGNRDAAALRAFHEGPRSNDALSTISDVQQARPYLQGVRNLEDFQSRITPAQQEIIAPYDQAINALGDVRVQGPDGPTTIKALDDERAQLSAQLRTLKDRGPEGIALAQQKGLTEANLLARQEAVQNALYPHLEAAGINPSEIMNRYGAVSRLGEDMSGKSTLIEKPQPYGLAKLVPSPLEAGVGVLSHGWSLLPKVAEIPGAMRDIGAGRFWKGSPTDIGMRETFGGAPLPKPDLGQLRPGTGGISPIAPPLQLGDGSLGRPVIEPPTPPAPIQGPGLPASTATGAAAQAPQSLLESLANNYATEEPGAPYRPYREPTVPNTEPLPDRGTIIVGSDGVARRGPAGLLPDRTGIPQLTSGAGNPEFVTPPPSPPAAFNPDTAVTNVNAGRPLVRPMDRPAEEPAHPINIPRSLPAPETHSFDAQQWQKAHPNGNVKAAIAKAQKAGYKIVNAGSEVAPRSQAQSALSEPPAAPQLTPQQRVMIRPGNGRVIDDSTIKAYLAQAGGDKAQARQAAIKDGWKVGK